MGGNKFDKNIYPKPWSRGVAEKGILIYLAKYVTDQN